MAGRHIEMRGTSAAMLLARAPRSIQHVSMDGVASMLAAVNEAVSEMSEKRMQLLIKIKTSPKYTSRLVSEPIRFLLSAASFFLNRLLNEHSRIGLDRHRHCFCIWFLNHAGTLS